MLFYFKLCIFTETFIRKFYTIVKSESTNLYIKNMVCGRCIKVVREELEKLGLKIIDISLGEVSIEGNAEPKKEEIRKVLSENGFELLEEKKASLIEQLKVLIIELIYKDEKIKPASMNYSEFIQKRLGYDYHYLSSLFSSTEQITIEHYIILQKIERAKELLKYGELTLSEIAYKLGYSSVQHLSNQFKKVTGLNATQFKNLSLNQRNPIDNLY
jgi:AraC family transcriptional regulator